MRLDASKKKNKKKTIKIVWGHIILEVSNSRVVELELTLLMAQELWHGDVDTRTWTVQDRCDTCTITRCAAIPVDSENHVISLNGTLPAANIKHNLAH